LIDILFLLVILFIKLIDVII